MKEFQQMTLGHGFWPIDWGYFRHVLLKTLVYADDVKIRWLMGLASIGVGVELCIAPATLDRPFFALMHAMLPAWGWIGLFFFHGFGALWRIFERRERMMWARVINGVGLATWVAFSCAQSLQSSRITLSSVLEGFACFFLFLAWTSTGWSSKTTTA